MKQRVCLIGVAVLIFGSLLLVGSERTAAQDRKERGKRITIQAQQRSEREVIPAALTAVP